ncbi:hypothetical protein E2562_028684 [Oryza meyeriana var. granulata]|uniref:Uncharacterized protein n=1 Tax=Oryza meyeriana var. granulata TaxID=110450 RepID=A0A6G1BQC3_9ORYZ|nr:hypothetical protein E2562_028684 [Oryza meyeriana var. granulata]
MMCMITCAATFVMTLTIIVTSEKKKNEASATTSGTVSAFTTTVMIIAIDLLNVGLLSNTELLHLFDLAMQSESSFKSCSH